MASEEQDMPTQQINTAKWWLALLGMVLFSITVAPDYPIQHVVLGLFIVIAIHLLVAFFRCRQAANRQSATEVSSSGAAGFIEHCHSDPAPPTCPCRGYWHPGRWDFSVAFLLLCRSNWSVYREVLAFPEPERKEGVGDRVRDD